MNARCALIKTTATSANPQRYKWPSWLDFTRSDFFSASTSSLPASSQRKSSAYCPSDKISPPIAFLQLSNSYPYKLSHSPRFMPPPSVSPDLSLLPLKGSIRTQNISYLLHYNKLLTNRCLQVNPSIWDLFLLLPTKHWSSRPPKTHILQAHAKRPLLWATFSFKKRAEI